MSNLVNWFSRKPSPAPQPPAPCGAEPVCAAHQPTKEQQDERVQFAHLVAQIVIDELRKEGEFQRLPQGLR